jgi:hypothetical protein
VGSSLLRWGDTKFFSPFEMNCSARARALLGAEAPAPDALLTGAEFVERAMKKLVSRAPLAGRVLERHAVVAIGRTRMNKRDLAAHPLRAERSFAVLVDSPEGEKQLEADVVLDASGVSLVARVGAGGLPAKGEREVETRIVRHLGELHARMHALARRSILVIGHGHSAANAIGLLARVGRDHPDTRITWATRSMNKKPCVAVADDPLPEREAIVNAANQLAQDPPEFLRVERRANVEAIRASGDRLAVTLSGGREGTYDVVCAFTGYRPDHSLSTELQVAISPVTEGAAGIDAKLSCVTDCLNVPKLAASDLGSGEAGFHLIGHKSYGRSSAFLLKDGIRQMETILESY